MASASACTVVETRARRRRRKQHANNVKLPRMVCLVTGDKPHTVTKIKNGIEFAAVTLPRLWLGFRSGRTDPLFAVPNGLPHLSRPPSRSGHAYQNCGRADDGFQPPALSDRQVTRIIRTVPCRLTIRTRKVINFTASLTVDTVIWGYQMRVGKIAEARVRIRKNINTMYNELCLSRAAIAHDRICQTSRPAERRLELSRGKGGGIQPIKGTPKGGPTRKPQRASGRHLRPPGG